MLLNFNKTCCLKLAAALTQHPKSFNLAMLSCPSQSVLELLSDDARFSSYHLGSMLHYFEENSHHNLIQRVFEECDIMWTNVREPKNNIQLITC